MEIYKVIRIVVTFMAIVGIAIWIASAVFFPDNSLFRIAALGAMVYGLLLVWIVKPEKKQTQLPK